MGKDTGFYNEAEHQRRSFPGKTKLKVGTNMGTLRESDQMPMHACMHDLSSGLCIHLYSDGGLPQLGGSRQHHSHLPSATCRLEQIPSLCSQSSFNGLAWFPFIVVLGKGFRKPKADISELTHYVKVKGCSRCHKAER